MLATENRFEQMTRLSERLTGKNGTDGSPCGFFHQHRQNRLASITESSVFGRLG